MNNETEIAKVGDTVEWSFGLNENVVPFFRGKTFQGEVFIIADEHYGVYAEYGQDYIPFSDATIIKRK